MNMFWFNLVTNRPNNGYVRKTYKIYSEIIIIIIIIR